MRNHTIHGLSILLLCCSAVAGQELAAVSQDEATEIATEAYLDA